MKTVSAALQTHLGQPNTTLAVLWKVTMLSGTVLAFTSFDKNIVYQGTTYLASSGFLPSANDFNSDMSVDSLEAIGFLDNVVIKESDIRNGLYDYALVEQHIVNWQNLAQGDLFLRKGIIGNITMKNGAFTAEIRGLTQFLSTYIGSLYGPLCRAELYSTPTNNVNPGDHYFCYVKESDYQQTGTVGTPIDALHFIPSQAGSHFVQFVKNNNNINPGPTPTLHKGNLVLVWVLVGNSSEQTISSISDGLGNTYTKIRHVFNQNVNSGTALELWYAYNVTGGAASFTQSGASPGGYGGWEIIEYSGFGTTDPLDTSGTQSVSSTPSIPLTLANNTELVVGSFIFQNATGWVWTNLTDRTGSGNIEDTVNAKSWGDFSAPSSGAFTVTGTGGSTTQLVGLAAAFKVAPGLQQKGSTTPTAPAPANWFNDGELTFTSGANNGLSFEIKTWDGTTLTLFLPMPFAPVAGDSFTIEPGCDKTPTVNGCLKFQGYSTDGFQTIVAPTNILNFRGEPFIPGNDLYFQYPDATTG